MTEPITFSAIGNYRTISWESPFKGVEEFRGWIIEVTGEQGESAHLFLEYRWSLNGSNWSLWRSLVEADIQALEFDPSKDLYIQVKATAVSDEDSSPFYEIGDILTPAIEIEDFDLDLEYVYKDPRDSMRRPSPLCSGELSDYPVLFKNCDFTFDPYAVNKGINLYTDLSNMVNNVFGHEVAYYSVQPQGRGKDVVLREYTLFDVVDEKCLKVMVPNNIFPDSKSIFDTFGVYPDGNFEVHVDRKYFESIWGKGAQPRKRDIIFFPLTNKIYQIESTYLFKDFNYYPVYWKIQLTRYEIKKNTTFIDPLKELELHDYTVSTKDLFGQETMDQETKLTKPDQYIVSTHRRSEDPARSYIHRYLPIIEYDFNNNWTIVFNSFYDLDKLFLDDVETSPVDILKEAVRWYPSPSITASEEMAFTCWFKIKNYIDRSKLIFKPYLKIAITGATLESGTILIDTAPIKHKLEIGTNPKGFISILGDVARTGGHKVIDVVDEYKFRIADSGAAIIGSLASWKMQKAQSRNLLTGHDGTKGIQIDMIYSGSNEPDKTNYLEIGSYVIKINDIVINSPFGGGVSSPIGAFVPVLEDWYGFVFNFSNLYKQWSIKTWGLTYDPENPAAQTSDLRLLHSKEGNLIATKTFSFPEDIETNHDDPTWGTNNNSYKVNTSPICLTNFRIFKHMIEDNKQSAILNQNIVGDSHMTILIDNAKPVLKSPLLGRNR